MTAVGWIFTVTCFNLALRCCWAHSGGKLPTAGLEDLPGYGCSSTEEAHGQTEQNCSYEMLSSAAELLPPLSLPLVTSSAVLIAVIVIEITAIENFHTLPSIDGTLFHLPRHIAYFTPLHLGFPLSETKQRHPARATCSSKEPHCPHLCFHII